ncbi:MAG: hypothetical protein ACRDSG_18235 [Pseudonocardiaceae bacterium]
MTSPLLTTPITTGSAISGLLSEVQRKGRSTIAGAMVDAQVQIDPKPERDRDSDGVLTPPRLP